MSQEVPFATPEESRQAILALTPVDLAKLMIIATAFWRRRLRFGNVEPDDLVQDAIVKTLDGSRKWNKSVSLLRHLDRTMESLSGHEAEKRQARKEVALLDDQVAIAGKADVYADVAANSEHEAILRLFSDDSVAMDILRLREKGHSANEIQQELGINKTCYESTAKKIGRRATKYLAEVEVRNE